MSPAIDWPLDVNVIRRGLVKHTFGMVRRNALGLPRAHQGWDFHAALGTPCFAVSAGRIRMIYESADYGKVAVLEFRHEGRVLFAAYAHLAMLSRRPGEPVNLGERIGFTGETGNARGMAAEDQHLHFELRTEPRPGKGLACRLSPIEIFGVCPLWKPIERTNHA